MIQIYDTSLPSGWEEKSLAQMVQLRRGYTWTKENEIEYFEEGAIPVIRIPNVQDKLDLTDLLYLRDVSPEAIEKAAVTKGWILFVGSNGSQDRIGDSVLMDEDRAMVFASFLMGITPKDYNVLLPDFLASWLRIHCVHERFSKTSQQTTGLANYSWGAVKKLPLRFPADVNEQRRIAAALKIADDAIAKAKAELEATRALKRSLMADVFENGLAPRVEKKLYKIHRCYTASVPAHWVTNPLGRSLQLVEYGTNAPSNEYQSGYPVIAIPQVVAPHLTLSDVPYAEVSEAEAKALRLMEDDVLLIRTNGNPEYIGKSTIVSEQVAAIHTIFASYLIRLRTNKDKLLGAYLNYFLASPLGRRQAGAVANTSAGNNNIGARAIRQFRLPRPPKEEQKQIVDLLNGVEDQINALSSKVIALQEVKKSLLQNLLTGKIRIPEGVLNG